MTSPPSGYAQGAERVYAAVRDWQRRNPQCLIKLPAMYGKRVVFIGVLSDCVDLLVHDNPNVAELAAYVLRIEPDATWLMFQASVELAYGCAP